MLSLGLFLIGIAAYRMACRARVREIVSDAIAHSGRSAKQLALDFEMDLGQFSRTVNAGTFQLADVLAFDEPVQKPIILAACREAGVVTLPDFLDGLRDLVLSFHRDHQRALPLGAGRRVA